MQTDWWMTGKVVTSKVYQSRLLSPHCIQLTVAKILKEKTKVVYQTHIKCIIIVENRMLCLPIKYLINIGRTIGFKYSVGLIYAWKNWSHKDDRKWRVQEEREAA